ncbi:ribonuclease HII [Alistipes sp. CAG:514]|nr:ribonuclease HII [Alistipes sp. CAG:514]
MVHGDATYSSIAAASVLAKTWRDERMRQLAKDYPEYGWDRNMGYPTKEHIEAIRKYGLTPWHRRSFHPKELEPTLFSGL